MAYKQPSSGLPFKEIGSSPAKQKGNNLKRIMTENKDAMKKAGTWYKTGTQSTMPKDFNIKGSSASTTPKYNTKGTGNFNFTGDSKSTTPKYSTTKAAKNASAKEFLKKNTVKLKPAVKPKGVFGPGTRPLHPKVAKDIAKVKKVGGKTLKKAGKFLGNKLIGTLAMIGAGTLNASATPTDKQGKKGSYTDDFTKLKQQLDNGKRIK